MASHCREASNSWPTVTKENSESYTFSHSLIIIIILEKNNNHVI